MATEIKDLNSYNSINKIDFGEKVIFFKFGGDWCVPCKQLETNLECIPDVILYNIDVENDEFESFTVENNIYTIPHTFVKYKNKTVDFKGTKSVEELTELISNLKNK